MTVNIFRCAIDLKQRDDIALNMRSLTMKVDYLLTRR